MNLQTRTSALPTIGQFIRARSVLSENYKSNCHFISLSAAGLLSLAGAHFTSRAWPVPRDPSAINTSDEEKHTGLSVVTSNFQTEGGEGGWGGAQSVLL